MRDAAFRDWLNRRFYKGKPLTPTSKSSRMSWLRALERSLSDLGFADGLDEVHAAGRWDDLLASLAALRLNWRSNEAAARSMAREAEDPSKQITSILAAARLYGHFVAGKDPNHDAEATVDDDRFDAAMAEMRETFLARMYDFSDMRIEDGEYWRVEKSYKYAARGDVRGLAANPALSDEERGRLIYERLCQSTVQGLPLSWRTRAEVIKAPPALKARFYRTIAELAAAEQPVADVAEEGAQGLEVLRDNGLTLLRRGEVLNIVLSVLGTLRPDESCWFKISMFDKAARMLTGERIFPSERFARAEFEAFRALLLRIRETLDEWGWQPESLEDVQGFLWVALSKEWDADWGPHPDPQAVDAAMAEYDELGAAGFAAKYPGFGTPMEFWVRGQGERASNIYPSKPIAAVAMGWESINGGWSRPDSACSLLHRAGYQIVDANGRPVTVPDKPYLTKGVGEMDTEASTLREAGAPATNLILYGPPGTGKTWRTAAEAVKLCDGSVPAGRVALMARYRELVEARRIDFATFHQNYSYEEFVEGLRPVTDGGAEGDGGSQGAGFRLEPRRGIFREICSVAENARKHAGRSGGFDLAGRKLFKMSLGRAGIEDHIFDAAIEGDYVVLGWGGDVDWSDPGYEDWSAMLRRWQQDNPAATGNDPNVVQMWPFRSSMKPGDLVVVSAGNSHFRAIGEVTGPYRFDPTETRDYNHRRPVRWLLVPDEPLPAEMIYGKKFMMQSCYQLKDALVNKEALSRLLPGGDAEGGGDADQFVLIIDEINRANISKVFGELITLIEPDKRLGAGPEALTVRLPYSGEAFGVPANLHIIGTMNTADRSIALLDTALRRRFVFREIAPDSSLLPEDVAGVPLRRVLETINDRIEYLIDREHRIGHAFFIGQGGRDRDAIDATMRDKVIPLLQEYFFEDWSRVAAVLGEPRGKGGGFLDCRKLTDPTGQDGEERESWSVRPAFAPDAYARLVGKLASAALVEEPMSETEE